MNNCEKTDANKVDDHDGNSSPLIIENDLTPSSNESDKEIIKSVASGEEKGSSSEEKIKEEIQNIDNEAIEEDESNNALILEFSEEKQGSPAQVIKETCAEAFPEEKVMSEDGGEMAVITENEMASQEDDKQAMTGANKAEGDLQLGDVPVQENMRSPDEEGKAAGKEVILIEEKPELLHRGENEGLPRDARSLARNKHQANEDALKGRRLDFEIDVTQAAQTDRSPKEKRDQEDFLDESGVQSPLELGRKNFENIDLLLEKHRILSKGGASNSSPKSRITITIDEKSRTSSFQEAYNPLKLPGDLKIAENHARAAKIGKLIPGETELCPCCGNHIKKQLMSLCCRNSDLSSLGAAFPVIFKLIKLVIVFICIPFLILVAIPHFILLSDECGSTSVTGVFTCKNSEDEEDKYNIILKVLTRRLVFDIVFSFYFMIAVLGIKIYLLRFKRKLKRAANIADYTILVKKLPKDIKAAREFCEGFNKQENFLPTIKEINCIYDFEEIYERREEIRGLIEERRKLMSLQDFFLLACKDCKVSGNQAEGLLNNYMLSVLSSRERGVSAIKKRISNAHSMSRKGKSDAKSLAPDHKEILTVNNNLDNNKSFSSENNNESESKMNKKSTLQIYLSKASVSKRLKEVDEEIQRNFLELEKLEKRLQSGEDLDKLFLGQCFVTFSRKELAKEICQDYSFFKCWRRKNRRTINGKQVEIMKAPEPGDILWQNLGYPLRKKVLLRLGLLAIELSVLVCFYLIIYVIHRKIHGEDLFTSFWKSLLVIVCNLVLEILLNKFILKEKHKTRSAGDQIIIRFMIPIMVYNIVMFELFSYLVVIVSNGCPDSIEHEQEYSEIIKKMYFVMLMQAVIESLFKLFDFKYLKKLYQRRVITKNKQKILYNQEEMNEIFEGPELELRSYYTDVVMVFLVGSFSWPFCPIVVLFTILGLVCFYWILKMSLLRRCVVQKHQCENSIEGILNLICVGPIFYVLMVYFMGGSTAYCSEYGVTDSEINTLNAFVIVEIVIMILIRHTPLDWAVKWKLGDPYEPYELAAQSSAGGYNHVDRILKS